MAGALKKTIFRFQETKTVCEYSSIRERN